MSTPQQQPWVFATLPTYKLTKQDLARGLRAVFQENINFEAHIKTVMKDNLQYYAPRILTDVPSNAVRLDYYVDQFQREVTKIRDRDIDLTNPPQEWWLYERL